MTTSNAFATTNNRPNLAPIPDDVLRARATKPVHHAPKNREPRAGDLRLVTSGGATRLVLVVKVHCDLGFARISLTHTYREYATNNDVIVEPSVSQAPYPVVVEPGLAGVVWLNEIGPLVATVPHEVVNACLVPRRVELTGPGLSCGLALFGPLDARYEFKEHELHELATLCASCTSGLDA